MKFIVRYRGVTSTLSDTWENHNFMIEHGVLRVRENKDKGLYKEVKIYREWMNLEYLDAGNKPASQT